ncbi:hypothetical protein LEMA_P071450.1 [Plenodomus lingam JN3]|uniref:NAD(P)-binding protein n=1 Tax=Leptosphaeria maculans (strain JN3 / isolate v23.1.3 / race Av1-4-5-6-7-8) TaxID=985895 RepID=E4ZK42_LEPMJ|nr:hypothetical protein LEMA_P071450.1 [Plenodomus lingam JN3]CBX91637.1 hypothetical protein LEMA_P071450.1 [Plenodomus lingam JN3]
MFRLVLLTVASIAVRLIKPQSFRLDGFSLTASSFTTLQWYLKWALPMWAVVDLNSALNRLAANRWGWKSDKSQWVWDKEVAVVTGGSGGIGACVVKRLVSVSGRQSRCLGRQPSRGIFHHRDNIREAAHAIRSDLGCPSILINNAGIGNAYTILDVPPASLQKLFDINLLSHWSTVQEFLPDMIAKKKGHIMSVASLASFVAFAGAVDYACTKAALLAFHEGLTQEIKHRYKCPEIKTSIVHPSWTKSAITSHPTLQAGLKSVGAKLLEPEDVASAMVNQILAAKSGQLVLGPALTKRIRALPLWLQEILRDTQANIVTGNGSTAEGQWSGASSSLQHCTVPRIGVKEPTPHHINTCIHFVIFNSTAKLCALAAAAVSSRVRRLNDHEDGTYIWTRVKINSKLDAPPRPLKHAINIYLLPRLLGICKAARMSATTGFRNMQPLQNAYGLHMGGKALERYSMQR